MAVCGAHMEGSGKAALSASIEMHVSTGLVMFGKVAWGKAPP